MENKEIILGKKIQLDIGGFMPLCVIPIEFKENGVLCEHLYAWSETKEIFSYEIFELNGFNITFERT